MLLALAFCRPQPWTCAYPACLLARAARPAPRRVLQAVKEASALRSLYQGSCGACPLCGPVHAARARAATHPGLYTRTPLAQGGHNGVLEFWDTEELTLLSAGEHFMAQEVQWDPTGRYVSTIVNAGAAACLRQRDHVLFRCQENNCLPMGCLPARPARRWVEGLGGGGREVRSGLDARQEPPGHGRCCLPRWLLAVCSCLPAVAWPAVPPAAASFASQPLVCGSPCRLCWVLHPSLHAAAAMENGFQIWSFSGQPLYK